MHGNFDMLRPLNVQMSVMILHPNFGSTVPGYQISPCDFLFEPFPRNFLAYTKLNGDTQMQIPRNYPECYAQLTVTSLPF
jgi:hypothetical protein